MLLLKSSKTRTRELGRKKNQAELEPATADAVDSDVQHMQEARLRDEPKKPVKYRNGR